MPQTSLRWPAPTWLDLFYDLAMAASAVAISGSFAYDYTWSGAAWFALTYAILGCFWLLTGFWSGSFNGDRPPLRGTPVAVIAVQMVGLLVLAVASGDSIADSEAVYDILLGLLLVSIVVLGWLSGRMGRRTPLVLGVGVACLIGSWIAPSGPSMALWLLVLVLLALETAMAVVSGPVDGPVDGPRLRHRLGELTVVIIGEVLVKFALTAGDESLWAIKLAALVPIVVILVAAWWAYFLAHRVSGAFSGRQRRTWVALHLPLHVGLLGLAVGLAKLLVGAKTLDDKVLNLLGGPVLLVLISLMLLHWAAGQASVKVLALAVVVEVVVLALAPVVSAGPTVTSYATAVVMLSAAIAAARK